MANEGTKKGPDSEKHPTHNPRHDDKGKQQQGGHKQHRRENEKATK